MSLVPHQAPIDGVRVLACLSVVWCHTFAIASLLVPPAGSPVHTFFFSDSLIQWMASGAYALDVFFMLSGYLLTTQTLAAFAAHRRVSVLETLLLRMLRLWPVMLVGLAVELLLGDTPYDRLSFHLFLSNVGPVSPLPTLLGVAWSNSVDVQATVAVVAVLLALRASGQLRRRSVVAVIVLLLAARLARFDRAETSLYGIFVTTRTLAGSSHSRSSTQFLNAHYNFTSPYPLEPLLTSEPPHFPRMYRPTLMRLSSFLVGTLLALQLQRADTRSADGTGILKCALLAASVLVFLLPLVGSDGEWPLAVDVFVTVFLHTVYAAAAAFILFTALVREQHRFAAPWLRVFLSAPVFQALSPLTYAVFVLHMRFVYFFDLSELRPSDGGHTHLFMLKLWLATVVTSFAVAYIVHLLVEKPAMQLVKHLKARYF